MANIKCFISRSKVYTLPRPLFTTKHKMIVISHFRTLSTAITRAKRGSAVEKAATLHCPNPKSLSAMIDLLMHPIVRNLYCIQQILKLFHFAKLNYNLNRAFQCQACSIFVHNICSIMVNISLDDSHYPRSMLHKSYAFCITLQFCYVFYTTFSLSPFPIVLDQCPKYLQSIQCCKISMHLLHC